MKKSIKITLLSILLATTFSGCAKNQITVKDVALAPVYGVLAVGYVATAATTVAITSAVSATTAVAKTGVAVSKTVANKITDSSVNK